MRARPDLVSPKTWRRDTFHKIWQIIEAKDSDKRIVSSERSNRQRTTMISSTRRVRLLICCLLQKAIYQTRVMWEEFKTYRRCRNESESNNICQSRLDQHSREIRRLQRNRQQSRTDSSFICCQLQWRKQLESHCDEHLHRDDRRQKSEKEDWICHSSDLNDAVW